MTKGKYISAILIVGLFCFPIATARAGDYDFYLMQGVNKRLYKVHVPAGYRKDTPTPLVIVFHGGGGSAQGSIDFFKLNPKADLQNFIVVYPEGTGKRVAGKIFASWNAGKCCPPATIRNIDDVGFISMMIDELKKNFAIDAKRIYATGFSNGALICYRLACQLSEKIAAIAVGGAHDAFPDCHPQRPVPILHFHGTLDNCGLYNGGVCGGCFADYLHSMGLPADRNASLWNCKPVPEYINEWRGIDGCSGEAKVVYQKGSATCISYDQCSANAEVVLCTLEGSGHTWPGGDYGNKMCQRNKNSRLCQEWINTVGTVNKDLSANDMLWEFFKKHPMEN